MEEEEEEEEEVEEGAGTFLEPPPVPLGRVCVVPAEGGPR